MVLLVGSFDRGLIRLLNHVVVALGDGSSQVGPRSLLALGLPQCLLGLPLAD